MVDYLVAKWNASAPEMERMGGWTGSVRANRYIGLVLTFLKKVMVPIITSIIGFSCLILLVGIFLAAVSPYLAIVAVYLDQWLKILFN